MVGIRCGSEYAPSSEKKKVIAEMEFEPKNLQLSEILTIKFSELASLTHQQTGFSFARFLCSPRTSRDRSSFMGFLSGILMFPSL